MMNPTVARIVEMMFENTEMTEEVAALHDEVMNNCQERYADLIASGIPEDDAVAAVVESLRGMEDVIGQYRRNSRRAAQQTPQRETQTYTARAESFSAPGERDLTFSPDEIHRIELTLVNEDVELEPSHDGLFPVRWECDGEESISCAARDGILRIERLSSASGNARHAANVHVDRSGRGAHIYVNGDEVSMEDSASVMEILGRVLGQVFGGMKRAMTSCDTVTIAVPVHAIPHVRMTTTSGDVSVRGVELAEMDVTTTSGDLEFNLPMEAPIDRLNARSTSGDVDACGFFRQLMLSSTSGDVEVSGRVQTAVVNTISGDIDVHADVERVEFKAISGDVDIAPETEQIRDISGSTISGDIDIDLPQGVGGMAINTHTRSGDVTTRYATANYGPTVSGNVSSMSGDITIR